MGRRAYPAEFRRRVLDLLAGGRKVVSLSRDLGVSEQTIYTWRRRFGTSQVDDVRRLKQLETENARLKKLVAERDLEIEVMKEINAKKW